MSYALWDWCPKDIDFRLIDQTYANEFGQTPHNVGEQYWSFDLNLPPKDDADTREIEALLWDLEGVNTLGVYDPRRPYPKQHIAAYEALVGTTTTDIGAGSTVGPQGAGSTVGPQGAGSHPTPAAYTVLTAMSRADKTITLAVENGETITVGDPIAFTDTSGIRHYFHAAQTRTASGGTVTVRVNPRPRYGLSEVSYAVERVKPPCWFRVQLTDSTHNTKEALFTDISLKGVEFWGPLGE